MKKILRLIILMVLIVICLPKGNFVSHQNFDKIFNLEPLNFFDARDINNQPLSSEDLKQLFVGTIYTYFVEEELLSFKSITAILLKPFADFWIVKELIKFFIEKVCYLFNNLRKFLKISINLFQATLFLFSILFYFKTHLIIYRLPLVVLRC